MFQPEQRASEPKVPDCDRCGAPSLYVIWDSRVCAPCAGDWFAVAEKAPSSSDFAALTRRWVAKGLGNQEETRRQA